MDALPHWPEGTVATLVTHGEAPHAIPVSLIVRAGPHELVVGLAPSRTSLARLREDPRAAITLLAEGVAFTAHGRATSFEESGAVIAVRVAVERIADHTTPAFTIHDGVRWEWTDDTARDRDATAREALARFAAEGA